MNFRRSFWGFAVTVLTLVALPALIAQFAGTPGTPGPWGRGFGLHGAPVTGEPYSAICTTTHVQTLDNGTTITHATVINEARDSSGRTYAASTVDGKNFTTYRVFDPVAGVSISWNSNSKIAYVMHLPSPGGQPQGNFQRPNGGQQGAGGPRGDFTKPTVENLGSKSFDGVTAEGTLITRTIPTGKVGNSQPLVSTLETWFSSDLKIVVSRVDTDPRMGTTTMQLSNISLNEPSSTLFLVPQGYTVQDRAGRGPRR